MCQDFTQVCVGGQQRLKIYSQCRRQLELLTIKSWMVTNIIIICIIFLHSLHIAKEHVGCPVCVFDVCSKQNTAGGLEAKLS